jgi:hypothetical protein
VTLSLELKKKALESVPKEESGTPDRCEEIRGLTDPEQLAEVIRNETNCSMRAAALRNPHFSDETLLVSVAEGDPDSSARWDAVSHKNFPDNQELLERIAYDDPEEGVRRAAVRKLTERSVLEELARNSIMDGVRWEVAKRIKDLP